MRYLVNHSAQIVPAFRAGLNDAIAERGHSARRVILRLPMSTAAAMYRILAGTTRDPRTSTLLALCGAIGVDPDELLDARRPAREPDRRLLVDLVRAFARRRSSP